VNAVKLVNDISDKESIIAQLKNTIANPGFKAMSGVFLVEKWSAEFQLNPTHYFISSSFNNDLRGTYLYNEYLTVICLETSIKYLRIVGQIIDNIDLQINLLQVDDNEYFKQIISEQQEKMKSLKILTLISILLLSLMKKE
jgi:hypothetical protein